MSKPTVLDIDMPEAAQQFFAAVQGGPGAEKMSASYRQWKQNRMAGNGPPETAAQRTEAAPRTKTKVDSETPVAPWSKITQPSINQSLRVQHVAIATSQASDTRADAGTVRGHDCPSAQNKSGNLLGDDRTKLYAPSLVAASKQPRPRMSYNGSARDGLASLSSIGSDYEEAVNRSHFQSPSETMMGADEKTETSRPWGNGPSDVEFDENPISGFPKWRFMVPVLPTTFLKDEVPGHWNYDVDTNTGKLLPPVDYPETIPQIVDEKNGLDFRRRTWTSVLLMRRKAELDDQLDKRDASTVHHMLDVPECAHNEDEYQEEIPDWKYQMVKEQVRVERMERARNPPHNTLSPRLPTYLRPAQISDMAQVAGGMLLITITSKDDNVSKKQ